MQAVIELYAYTPLHTVRGMVEDLQCLYFQAVLRQEDRFKFLLVKMHVDDERSATNHEG